MDLLGPSIAEQQKDGAGVMVKTVIRIVDQAVHRIRFPASYSVLNVACSSLCIVTSSLRTFFAHLTIYRQSKSLTSHSFPIVSRASTIHSRTVDIVGSL